ncbi:MAG: esterase-like activity of phytase family protein, partial [Pseudomonadota bacterium]
MKSDCCPPDGAAPGGAWLRRRGLAVPLLLAGLLGSTLAFAQPAAPAPAPLRYLGQQNLPRGLSFEGTTIGGLSGLDRDDSGTFFALSD